MINSSKELMLMIFNLSNHQFSPEKLVQTFNKLKLNENLDENLNINEVLIQDEFLRSSFVNSVIKNMKQNSNSSIFILESLHFFNIKKIDLLFLHFSKFDQVKIIFDLLEIHLENLKIQIQCWKFLRNLYRISKKDQNKWKLLERIRDSSNKKIIFSSLEKYWEKKTLAFLILHFCYHLVKLEFSSFFREHFFNLIVSVFVKHKENEEVEVLCLKFITRLLLFSRKKKENEEKEKEKEKEKETRKAKNLRLKNNLIKQILPHILGLMTKYSHSLLFIETANYSLSIIFQDFEESESVSKIEVLNSIFGTFLTFPGNGKIQEKALFAINSVVSDPSCKNHYDFQENEGIKCVQICLKKFRRDENIQIAICNVLSSLAINKKTQLPNEIQGQLEFALPKTIKTMRLFPNNPRVQGLCCRTLRNLVVNDGARFENIAKRGGIGLIKTAIQKNYRDLQLLDPAFDCLSYLAENPTCCEQIVKFGFADIINCVLDWQKMQKRLQRQMNKQIQIQMQIQVQKKKQAEEVDQEFENIRLLLRMAEIGAEINRIIPHLTTHAFESKEVLRLMISFEHLALFLLPSCPEIRQRLLSNQNLANVMKVLKCFNENINVVIVCCGVLTDLAKMKKKDSIQKQIILDAVDIFLRAMRKNPDVKQLHQKCLLFFAISTNQNSDVCSEIVSRKAIPTFISSTFRFYRDSNCAKFGVQTILNLANIQLDSLVEISKLGGPNLIEFIIKTHPNNMYLNNVDKTIWKTIPKPIQSRSDRIAMHEQNSIIQKQRFRVKKSRFVLVEQQWMNFHGSSVVFKNKVLHSIEFWNQGWRVAKRKFPKVHDLPVLDSRVFTRYSGFLIKRGLKFQTWKTRWFVLTDESFSYYKSKNEISCIKEIKLSDIINIKKLDKNNKYHKDYCFEIITKSRILPIQAETEEKMEGWISIITETLEIRRLLQKNLPILNDCLNGNFSSLTETTEINCFIDKNGDSLLHHFIRNRRTDILTEISPVYDAQLKISKKNYLSLSALEIAVSLYLEANRPQENILDAFLVSINDKSIFKDSEISKCLSRFWKFWKNQLTSSLIEKNAKNQNQVINDFVFNSLEENVIFDIQKIIPENAQLSSKTMFNYFISKQNWNLSIFTLHHLKNIKKEDIIESLQYTQEYYSNLIETLITENLWQIYQITFNIFELLLDCQPKSLNLKPSVWAKIFSLIFQSPNYADVLFKLISLGINIDSFQIENSKITPFQFLVSRNEVDIVEKILKEKHVNISSTKFTEDDIPSIMHFVCQEITKNNVVQKSQMVKLLLEYGADCKIVDKQSRSALHHCISGKFGDVLINEEMSENGLDINIPEDRSEIQLEILFDQLESHSLVNQTDSQARTILMSACQHGETEIVSRLIKTKNVQLMDRDLNGWIALHYSIKFAKFEIVKFLLQIDNKDNSQILVQTKNNATVFHLAVMGSIDLDASSEIFTLLYSYYKKNFDKDPDLNQLTDQKKNSVLHLACINGHKNIVSEICKIKDVDLNLQNFKGKTPLMCACESLIPSVEIVKNLILNGVSKTLKCKEEKTAYDYAIQSGNTLFLGLLK